MAKHLSVSIEESIPKRVLPPRRRNLPWLNKNLVKSMRREIHYTEGLKNLVIHFILQNLSQHTEFLF